MLVGRDAGTTCELAQFRSWKPREIARLATRGVFSSDDLAKLAYEVIGVDMTVREHMLFVGLDKRNRVTAIGDGTSPHKHLCAFMLMDAVAAMVGSTKTPGQSIHGVVMAHNHPSGTFLPSDDDILTTKNVLSRFKVVPLIDHAVVSLTASGAPAAYSFREERSDMFR